MSPKDIIRGVIHDGRGQWILGYYLPFGKCTGAVVELWGILDGLLLLQKQGYAEVIIQSNNLENVISLCESKLDGPKSFLIRRIQQILAFEEKWSLNYIPRESNQVANALAKMALTRSETLYTFEEPLVEIKGIMKKYCTFDNEVIFHYGAPNRIFMLLFALRCPDYTFVPCYALRCIGKHSDAPVCTFVPCLTPYCFSIL
ncbi:hypothetical protein J1N35_010300 [Gossypium stocksii]|uniref:RNase H type-1 domain-containing protein n=1 Tax=Gossypium stocksii TaxID=47602 RepID=A0A9D3W0V3_9ROSI|nr:hypothetical protein J1N35_010300 [Gossypium stocksii]